MIEQGVHQRSAVISGCGMNHHPFGLVDNDYVFVLVDYVKGNVLGNSLGLLTFGQSNVNAVACLYGIFFRLDSAAYQHVPLFNQSCRLRSGYFGHLGTKGVETLAPVRVVYGVNH